MVPMRFNVRPHLASKRVGTTRFTHYRSSTARPDPADR
jgi:hypothetical protein